MKKIFTSAIFLFSIGAFAQEDLQGQIDQLKAELQQIKNTQVTENIQKEEPLQKFNVFFNFQSSFDGINMQKYTSIGSNTNKVEFRARQLRLEIKGNLTERIFYRFRHRLNRPTSAAGLDNLARATDMLYAGFHLNDKFSLIAGKMCQAWGGFEFDINPMNIYEYLDFIDNMDNFMLGGMLTYHPNENHEFNIQITDVRNNTFQELYGDNTLGIKESKSPLAYIYIQLEW